MSNSDFEKNVQDELDDLSFEPSDGVWDRVEASLPRKDRRRWLLLFIPLLLGGAIFFMADYSKTSGNTEQPASKRPPGLEQFSDKSKQSPQKINATLPLENAAKGIAVTSETYANAKRDSRTNTGTGSQKSTDKNISYVKNHRSKNNVGLLSDPGGFTSNVRNTLPEANADNNIASLPAPTQYKSQHPDTSVAEPESFIPFNVSPPKHDIITVMKSTDTIVKELPKEKNEKKNVKWMLGVTAGVGHSNIKSGLFNKNQRYAEVLASGSPSGIPASPSTSPNWPNEPEASFAFTAGLSLDKNISRRVTFHTGFNYAYLSSRIQVGAKVDSSGRIFTNSGSAFVQSYYRNGSTGSYINRFHFISLPVTLQFTPVDRLPLYGEAGLTTSFLINSNVLQYSSNNNAYFKNENSHNRLIFGLQAGIGAHVKSLTLGYRFNYSLTSVTKDALPQYPVSSVIYLQLPLKKF